MAKVIDPLEQTDIVWEKYKSDKRALELLFYGVVLGIIFGILSNYLYDLIADFLGRRTQNLFFVMSLLSFAGIVVFHKLISRVQNDAIKEMQDIREKAFNKVKKEQEVTLQKLKDTEASLSSLARKK